tara:strand:- start:1986 stop:2372 length:387 start_codon:yes stop_codon:yes gene_type:complete
MIVPIREKKNIIYKEDTKHIFDLKDQYDLSHRNYELKKLWALKEFQKAASKFRVVESEYKSHKSKFWHAVEEHLDAHEKNLNINKEGSNNSNLSIWIESSDEELPETEDFIKFIFGVEGREEDLGQDV